MHLLFFKNVVGEHTKFGIRDNNASFLLCLAHSGLLWVFPKIEMSNSRCVARCLARGKIVPRRVPAPQEECRVPHRVPRHARAVLITEVEPTPGSLVERISTHCSDKY